MSKTPVRKHLGIMPDDLADNLLGQALYAGKMRATLVSQITGQHIAIGFTLNKKGDRWKIRVSNSPDEVGDYYIAGKWAGTLFPAKNWDTGQIVADPARYWVAEKLLRIAAGLDPVETVQYSVQVGAHCFRCGAELDEPESIASGFGPVCRTKVSEAYGTRHQRRAPAPRPAEQTQPAAAAAPEPDQSSLFIIRPGESLTDIYARLERA